MCIASAALELLCGFTRRVGKQWGFISCNLNSIVVQIFKRRQGESKG